jgi:fructosamine-3-kinase
MSHWEDIAAQIAVARGRRFAPRAPRQVGGGCINRAMVLTDGAEHVFVKLNSAECLDMFEAEAAGLAEMADSATIRVPQPLCTGTAGPEAFIAMEYIELGSAGGDAAAAGRQLAAMHRTRAQRFGWYRDNTIGSTPQSNRQQDDWVAFWRSERLGLQLDLAARNGFGGRLRSRGERLLAAFPVLVDHAPEPSLLHGDLWGGNLGFAQGGQPVIFDPAVYYGDRETDLAMTELFGGFGPVFHAAYNEVWPVDAGYTTRRTLYNLYHILNHVNLFGSGYVRQAERMIDQLLAEIG